MRSLNKRGIELSANFIVMFILALVVFMFGLYFLKSIVDQSKTVIRSIPTVEDAVLDGCIERAEDLICVAKSHKTIKRGEIVNFGIAINNKVKRKATFALYVDLSFAKAKDDTPIDLSTIEFFKWTYKYPEYTIANNDYQKEVISFDIPDDAQAGTYAFSLHICYNDTVENGENDKCSVRLPDLYGSSVKFYAEVI